MKTKTIALTILTGLLTAGAALAADTNLFKSDKEKLSYALGMQIGTSLKNFDVDLEVMIQELKNAMSGITNRLTPMEAAQTIRGYLAEKQKQTLEKNKKDGETFLEANKTKPGVISLPNGLQYKILAEGTGDSPKPEDIVEVNYRGTFIDGTEFDSSEKAGKPLTTALNRGIIRGWTEGITRMKPGAKWQLFIPTDLAYGERGYRNIEPNKALIFDVELLSFKPAPPVTNNVPTTGAQPLTSDIIKVPSLEEMKKGAKIETIKAEDVEKLQKQQAEKPKAEPK